MNVVVSPPGMTLVADHAHEHDPAASALSGFWLFMMSDLISKLVKKFSVIFRPAETYMVFCVS